MSEKKRTKSMVLGKIELGIINHFKVNVSPHESLPRALTECRLPAEWNLLVTSVFVMQCAVLQEILSVLGLLKGSAYLEFLIKLLSDTHALTYAASCHSTHWLHSSCGAGSLVRPPGPVLEVSLPTVTCLSFQDLWCILT